MVASGCAALGYQIVWTQQAALWLGHEGAAALAVVAAFFGGLALGAGGLGAAIDRSARPGGWYAGCEAAIALWALLLVWGLEPASQAINTLLGPAPSALWQSTVTFGSTFLVFLPATLAMGATLPAMARLLSQLRAGGSNLAALYAGNTLGGVLGVLGVAFWLVPQWGLSAAAGVCALLNVACAGGA
jgi:spermidine synthase